MSWAMTMINKNERTAGLAYRCFKYNNKFGNDICYLICLGPTDSRFQRSQYILLMSNKV